MAETPDQFLKGWKNTYIFAESRSLDDLETVMEDIIADAEEANISIADLNEAAGGDLRQHIIGVLKKMDMDI